MSAGEIAALRHRILIEAQVRTPGSGGTATISWSPAGEAWAAIEPISGREVVEADGLGGRITHEVRMRWRPGITPDHRLRLGMRLFEIRGVRDEGEAHRWLVCRCEERLP